LGERPFAVRADVASESRVWRAGEDAPADAVAQGPAHAHERVGGDPGRDVALGGACFLADQGGQGVRVLREELAFAREQFGAFGDDAVIAASCSAASGSFEASSPRRSRTKRLKALRTDSPGSRSRMALMSASSYAFMP
jgi:hypothetical protein